MRRSWTLLTLCDQAPRPPMAESLLHAPDPRTPRSSTSDAELQLLPTTGLTDSNQN